MLTKEEIDALMPHDEEGFEVGIEPWDLRNLCDMALLALEEKALVRQMLEGLKATSNVRDTEACLKAFGLSKAAIAAAEKFLNERS